MLTLAGTAAAAAATGAHRPSHPRTIHRPRPRPVPASMPASSSPAAARRPATGGARPRMATAEPLGPPTLPTPLPQQQQPGEQRSLQQPALEAPSHDAMAICLLAVLYVLQGVPIGLVFGTVPLLLSRYASLADVGFLSLAGYPYVLKLLWSPVVDACYVARVGRRKSWIVPMQLALAALLWYFADNAKLWLSEAFDVGWLMGFMLVMIVCASTQDIAVDGLALELLSRRNSRYASTCQTVGLSAGYFAAFTVFLALESEDFCNAYLRSAPAVGGVVDLPLFLRFWSVAFLAATAYLVFLIHEVPSVRRSTDRRVVLTAAHRLQRPVAAPVTVLGVYRDIWRLLRMPHLRNLLLVLAVHKFGFVAHESAAAMRLIGEGEVDRPMRAAGRCMLCGRSARPRRRRGIIGFRKEDVALTAVLDFPVEIFIGIFIARLTAGRRPLRPVAQPSRALRERCLCNRPAAADRAPTLSRRPRTVPVGDIPAASTGADRHGHCTGDSLRPYYDRLRCYRPRSRRVPLDGLHRHDGRAGAYAATAACCMRSPTRRRAAWRVCQGAFFVKISDPAIGGTYLTLLNTASNFGGTWPKLVLLRAMDYATVATCSIGTSRPGEAGPVRSAALISLAIHPQTDPSALQRQERRRA